MVFDTDQKPAEKWRQNERKERDAEGREDRPEQEGMPLPEPELTDKVERMLARGVEELARGERHWRGVEYAAGGVNERDHQDDFERIHDVIAEL